MIQTENLSVAPVFPLQALFAYCEEGLTAIDGRWKMGPLVSFYVGDCLETHLNKGQLGFREDFINCGRADKAGDGSGRIHLKFHK